MKNILLDHGRRWWWVFLLGSVFGAALGWSVAAAAPPSEYWHGKHANSLILTFALTWNFMLVMQSSCLAVFTGALLLMADLQRGLVRTVAVLPMTGRQLGRTWWLATVGGPASLFLVILFVGAGVFHLFHPDTALPVGRLLLAGWLIFLWLGTGFVIYFVHYASQGIRWGKLANFISTLIIIWMMFGFGLNSNAQKNPCLWMLFQGLGLLMTSWGWWRAGQFVPGQAKPLVRTRNRFRIQGALTPLPLRDSPIRHPGMAGSGGIPLLGRVTFFQALFLCLFTAVPMPLAMAWQGQVKSWSSAIELVAGLATVYCAIGLFAFLPALRQVRQLRTLPLSASRLALVLLVLALLPLLALGALIAAVAWWSTDAATTCLAAKNFLFILAPASFGLAAAVWRGTGVQTYVMIIPILIATAFGSVAIFERNPAWSLIAAVVATSILLSFLMTSLALGRSSRPYRAPDTASGGLSWLGSK